MNRHTQIKLLNIVLLSFVSFKGEILVRESEDSTSDTLFSNSFGSPVPDGLTIFCVSIADLKMTTQLRQRKIE